MVVASAYYISNTLQAIDDTIAACTDMMAIMGAYGAPLANAAAVQALGKWQDYRIPETAPYYRLVFLSGTDVERAIKGSRHTVSVEFYACWPVATLAVAGDSERDKTMRATNAFGAILEQLTALIGTTTGAYVMKAVRQYEPPQMTADNDDHPDCWDATILFSVEI